MIMQELFQQEPSYRKMTRIIEADLGLSYKILKLANSVHYSSRNEIKNLSHALAFIGICELKKWSSILLLKSIGNVENAELIKVCIIRGKIMELAAKELNLPEDSAWFYFMGMFSYIDVLMNQPMFKVLEGLPLPEPVKRALLGEESIFSQMLSYVAGYDMSEPGTHACDMLACRLGSERFMELYHEAIVWAQRLEY